MTRNGRARALAAALAVLLVGCGSTPAPTSPAQSGAPAGPTQSGAPTGGPSTALPSPAATTLPASGGTVALSDGASLVVPAGAVPAGKTASIAALPAPTEPPSPAWPERPVGQAYRFDLAGATPAKPVTISLPFTAASLPQGVTPDELVLASYDTATATWVPVPATVDAGQGRVTAQVSHFSMWALWAPDWDYWLALLKSAASGDVTRFLHAVSTFASGCSTSASIYTVDNSAANKMVEGCLKKTSASAATLEMRNLRAFALEVSDPRGYLPEQPTLLAPGDAVSFDVSASDASPVLVAADMSRRGLTASVVDIVLGLLPNISTARLSPAWRAAFTEIVDEVDQLHALTDAVSEADAGHYPQAAEAAVKAISGIDFLTALAAAVHAAGVAHGIPALASISGAGLKKATAVVGLGDLIVTAWSFFGDYFFNAHTEVRLSWNVPPPTAPTSLKAWLDPPSDQGMPNVHYSWKAPSGDLDGYYLIEFGGMCTVGSSCFTPVCGPGPDITQLPASATSYEGPAGSGMLEAWICAFNKAGTSPLAEFQPSSAAAPTGPPAKPIVGSYELVSSTTVAAGTTDWTYRITWTDPTDTAEGFHVYFVFGCYARHSGDDCVRVGMHIPPSDLVLAGTAPNGATSFDVKYTANFEGMGFPDAVLISAFNRFGESKATIATTATCLENFPCCGGSACP